MNFKKILLTILLVITIISIFGFHDIKKPEHSAYVLAIGIDKAENDKILLTLQCLPPNILNQNTGVKEESDRLYNTSIVASSLEEGVALAHNYMSTNLTFGHVRAVIFSEEVAKSGISKYLISLTDNKMNDTNMNIYISKCNAQKFIENISPKLETNPVLYYDLIEHVHEKSAASAPIKLIDFLRNLYDDVKVPMATYCNVIEENDDSYLEKSLNNHTLNPSFLPGNIPAKSKAKTEVLGLAIFKGDKMIDYLDNIETSNHLLLQNDIKFMYRTINGPQSNENIKQLKTEKHNETNKEINSIKNRNNNLTSVQLIQTRKCNIEINIKNNVPTIDIIVPLNYIIVNTNTNSFNYIDRKYMNELEKSIENSLNESMNNYFNKMQNTLKLDIDSFGKYIKPKFLTNKKYENYQWNKKFTKAKINVKFNLACRTPGLYKQR